MSFPRQRFVLDTTAFTDAKLIAALGGTIKDAVIKARHNGLIVSQAHLRYLNPLPKNTESVLRNFKRILIPEINLGQLARLIRSEYLIPVEQLNLERGLPLKVNDILEKITTLLGGGNGK